MYDSLELTDFFKNKVVVNSKEELYNLYILFTDQQNEHFEKKIGKKITERQSFLTWLNNRNVCPLPIITKDSDYWLETICICDGEHGISLPGDIDRLPFIFYQALSIVRKARSEATNGN